MAFGIYKSGQGYWTRVMTAIGVGMLGVMGLYLGLEPVDDAPPKSEDVFG